jgi:hypothetical protein
LVSNKVYYVIEYWEWSMILVSEWTIVFYVVGYCLLTFLRYKKGNQRVFSSTGMLQSVVFDIILLTDDCYL